MSTSGCLILLILGLSVVAYALVPMPAPADDKQGDWKGARNRHR
jgi:hypothetical protein